MTILYLVHKSMFPPSGLVYVPNGLGRKTKITGDNSINVIA